MHEEDPLEIDIPLNGEPEIRRGELFIDSE